MHVFLFARFSYLGFVGFFVYFCVFSLACFELPVPVQMIAGNDSSPECVEQDIKLSLNVLCGAYMCDKTKTESHVIIDIF